MHCPCGTNNKAPRWTFTPKMKKSLHLHFYFKRGGGGTLTLYFTLGFNFRKIINSALYIWNCTVVQHWFSFFFIYFIFVEHSVSTRKTGRCVLTINCFIIWTKSENDLNAFQTRSGSVLTGLIPPAATNSSFPKSRSKSRSRPLSQKFWYQQKGLVTRNRYV